MKIAVALLSCVAVAAILFGWFAYRTQSTAPSAVPRQTAERSADPVASKALPQPSPPRDVTPEVERMAVPGDPQAIDEHPASLPNADAVSASVPPEVVVEIDALKFRIDNLLQTIDNLKLELDECRNGPDSPLGALYALPEWSAMNKQQRATIMAFVQTFHVTLLPGEALLIVNYKSPTHTQDKDLIAMLGLVRVWNSMGAEARERMQREFPEAFYEYFGELVPRPPEDR